MNNLVSKKTCILYNGYYKYAVFSLPHQLIECGEEDVIGNKLFYQRLSPTIGDILPIYHPGKNVVIYPNGTIYYSNYNSLLNRWETVGAAPFDKSYLFIENDHVKIRFPYETRNHLIHKPLSSDNYQEYEKLDDHQIVYLNMIK
jgi:hypothetical protein